MNDQGLLEHITSRFLSRARWRCLRCDSPWFAATTLAKARSLLAHHWKGCGR